MRRLLCLALALLLLPAAAPRAAVAQTAPATPSATQVTGPTSPTAPRTTIPSDGNSRARPTWYDACRTRVAEANASANHIDLLFVGDSITEGWTSVAWGGENRGAAVWNKTYAPRNALNFGVGADRTQDVLYRLNTMDVQKLTPKVAVLLIGTNNTQDPAPDIAAGVHAILDRLQQLYPAAKIILVSILPNARAAQRMTDTNALIRPYADNRTIFYFDLAAQMPPVGDNWLGLGPDKLHPTEAGYQIWADAMEPLLTQLLAAPQPPLDSSPVPH